MNRAKRNTIFFAIMVTIGAVVIALNIWEPEYAYIPPEENILPMASGPAVQSEQPAYDLWGHTVTHNESFLIKNTRPDGESMLSPANGAVEINEETLKLGREAFYKETFGNEVFLTDIMGAVNGPLSIPQIAKAILKLRGKGTNNLQVELASDAVIGGQNFKKGQLVDTGLDVPKGAYAPLGMPIKFSQGELKVGITCAACHATVDYQTKKVIEGAPNQDLNAGLLLALATNSAAYFTHTDVNAVADYLKHINLKVQTTNGKTVALPDPKKLEQAVDAAFLKWPRGNFDSTIDLKNNPAQIPDSFTLGDHPYGWSGFAAGGPFKGLSTFSNNVHAQNSDSLAQAKASPALFGIDEELYLGILLQNAADPNYRYNAKSKKPPSQFFAMVDPTPGVVGVNELVKSPSFPKVNLMAPDGLFISSPGFKLGEQVNAMSAWQNSIRPAPARLTADQQTLRQGKTVFTKARCITCHAGPSFTNNLVIDSRVIGTEPSRAKAFKATQQIFGDASIYAFDTPVPIPKGAKILEVPTAHLDPKQIKLAYAHGNSPGGYKVKGLIGLYWTAPYLHDGGVAVGPDANTQLGLTGTLLKGIAPDPANSLRALLDRDLRNKVIAANKASQRLQDVHVQGIGHAYWVDSAAGFSKSDQEALIRYLLSLKLNK
jgi:hypothetical protein